MMFTNFLKQSTLVGGWRITGTASGLLIAFLIVRLLDTTAAAAYFLGFSIVMFASLLGRLGLRQSAVRAVADARKYRGLLTVVILRIMTLALAGGIVTGLVLFHLIPLVGLEWFDSPLLAEAAGELAVWVFLMSMQSAVTEALRGLCRIGIAAMTDNVFQFMLIAMIFAILSTSDNEPALRDMFLYCNGAYGLTLLASSLILALGVRKIPAASPGSGGNRIWSWRSLLFISLPIMGVNLATYIVRQGGLWVVGALGQPAEVAAYAIALRIFALLDFPLLVFRFALDPHVASVTPSSAHDIEVVSRRAATVATVVVLLFLVLWVSLGQVVLDHLFGTPYQLAFLPVLILSVMRLASALAGPAASLVLMQGGQQFYLMVNVTACLLSLAATAIGHQAFGLGGAALGAGAGALLQSWCAWFWSHKHLGIRTHAAWPGLPGSRGRTLSSR